MSLRQKPVHRRIKTKDYMLINRQRIYLPLSVLFMFSLLTSCFDEKLETNVKEGQ